MRKQVRRIHFIGVGGAGMSGIAEVLLGEGYQVSGSDRQHNEAVQRLQRAGLDFLGDHDARHVAGADVVVVSSAIPPDNPERLAAHEAGIAVAQRAQMLADLMRLRSGIAVAGTHGKTTTTSLIASLLAQGGLDPTFVIGGRLNSIAGNARLGQGRYLVAEADESDASFLHLQPLIAVVTNVDRDHMQTYGADPLRLHQSFLAFLQQLPFNGLALLCADDPVLRELRPQIGKPALTYGFAEDADYLARDVVTRGMQSRFKVVLPGEAEPLAVTLSLPGRHNVANALAAIAVAHQLEIGREAICRGLAEFAGIARRSQQYPPLPLPGGGEVVMIDDYAHHPREIGATLTALREAWPGRRLVVMFQPHRYSRTQDLFEDFVSELSAADLLVLCEVYAAGEEPIPGAEGRSLASAIRLRGGAQLVYVDQPLDAVEPLRNLLRDGDVLVTMGAGSISALAPQLPRLLEVA